MSFCSTRPFLSKIEKKWITFQILTALCDARNCNFSHGDIKSENVLVTSWNWVYLTDFASYKPTYPPPDDVRALSAWKRVICRNTLVCRKSHWLRSSDRKSKTFNIKTGIYMIGTHLTGSPKRIRWELSCQIRCHENMMTDGVMGSRHNGNNNLIKIRIKRNMRKCLPTVSEVG
jgi:serine/threonine protein kinase